MRKYIVAISKMLTSNKWMVVSIKNEIDAHFVGANINCNDCNKIANELKEMAKEVNSQEDLVNAFKNN